MGQQQLLLVILVTIIVGIATVVAINTFSSAADSANVDAARQDALSIAAAAQQYYMKPNALGGGGQDFTNINFDQISGVPVEVTTSDNLQASNDNGTYVISGGGSGEFTLTVYPASCADGAPPFTSCATAGDELVATVIPDGITWNS